MNELQDDERIYVDLEYCYPGMTSHSGRPLLTDERQVIQMAAIRFDHKRGKEIASFDVLVRPLYAKQLPEFFVELTAITQDQVDVSGIDFPDALRQFTLFCDNTPVYTFDQDWEVLEQNCTYYDIDYPFKSKRFHRVKAHLPEWGVSQDEYSSGTLYKAAGLMMDGHVHNALHDVRSMAMATSFFSR